jgi:hypothetical protein
MGRVLPEDGEQILGRTKSVVAREAQSGVTFVAAVRTTNERVSERSAVLGLNGDGRCGGVCAVADGARFGIAGGGDMRRLRGGK